jgi:chemotaxis protein methyltransferase CheR
VFYTTEKFDISKCEENAICKFAFDHAGLVQVDKKIDIIKPRLYHVVKMRRCENLAEYLELAHSAKSTDIYNELLNIVTTHNTGFFRSIDQFDYVSEFYSKSTLSKEDELRVWSAACSSGEEAYSIAMIVNELLDKKLISSYNVVASDVSRIILEEAIGGIYPESKMKTLSTYFKNKYFEQGAFGQYRIKSGIRNNIDFKTINLIRPCSESIDPFDMIFCRNLLVYFDKDNQNNIVERLHGNLKEGGLLFVEYSDSALTNSSQFKSVAQGVYRKV